MARAAEALRRIEAWAAEHNLDFRHECDSGFGAVFSRCGTWRYLLWRFASPRAGLLGMGMLNPSKADELADDPTVARCRALARREGYANLLVWNLFALRATDPAELRQAADPIGPDNDAASALALSLAGRMIVAWGNHGSCLDRAAQVLRRCDAAGNTLAHLGLTQQGQPRHPLYLAGTVRPRRWKTATSPVSSSR